MTLVSKLNLDYLNLKFSNDLKGCSANSTHAVSFFIISSLSVGNMEGVVMCMTLILII